MMATTPVIEYQQRSALVPTSWQVPHGRDLRPDHWVEPRTGTAYPVRYEAYRRMREAQERPLPGHRKLGPDVDRYVWQRWGHSPSPDVEILLTLRTDTPTRIRRLVADILRAIRHGRPAPDAIREVSRQFGLRPARTRACLAACLGFAALPRGDALSRLTERPWLS
jgi:hypothetical protein